MLKGLDIKHTENSRMINFMGDPVLKQYWTINCGLPKDDTSTENGIIIEKSKRWTLMIDPQTQANKFIKNMGKDRTEGFEVMKASDSTIMRTLEKAIQFGSWILIENVGKVNHYYHYLFYHSLFIYFIIYIFLFFIYC